VKQPQENINISEKVKEIILKHALLNAIKHEGKASVKAVISKVIGEDPSLKSRIRQVLVQVKETVNYVNSLTLEEQKRIIEERWPELLVEEHKTGEKILPPLPNVNKYKIIVTRFAPNPDFVLHLGNARPAVLSYEYARLYKGKFILRFEDTDPKTKKPMLEAYDLIKEDLKWLGIKWDEEYIQSQRMEIYYNLVKELIQRKGAYVCLCTQEEFRKYRDNGKACPHREQSVETNLELWDKMIRGDYSEGEAVLRIKTDLKHPDPSIRDWVAFRIIDTNRYPHPLTGSKYVAWPTYNFAAAVDDHLLGVTHILRAKEHYQNTIKQKYLYAHMGWEYPETIHFGRLKIEGFILSKSKIRKLLEEKPEEYEGYDDPRFGTLRALRKRGFLPETIRKIVLDVGIKSADAKIHMDNLSSINRKIIDPVAHRILFVKDPVKLRIKGLTVSKITIPFHPTNKDLGSREIVLDRNDVIEVYVSREDIVKYKNKPLIRLMELVNIRVVKGNGKVWECEALGSSLDDARKLKAPIIQWVPVSQNVDVIVKKPEGTKLQLIKGVAEKALLDKRFEDRVVQFVRFGFVRIDNILEDKIIAYYTHD